MGQGLSDYARLLVGVSIVAPLLAWLVLLAHVLGRPRPSEAPLGPEGRLVLRKIALMVVPPLVALVSGLLPLRPFLIATDGPLRIYWPSDQVFEAAAMQFVGVFLGLAIAGGLLAVRVLSGRLTRAAGSVRPDGSLAAGWSQAGRLVPKLWLAFTSPAMLVSLVSLPGLIAGSIRLA